MADRPTFSEDDGAADPRLRAALEDGRIDLELLQDSRLLMALLPDDGDMSLVSMVNAEGELGVLAFTGLDAMQRWQPQARPVPVTGREAAQLASDEGASALVIDVLGPARTVVRGSALRTLAQRDGDSPGP